MKIFDTLAGSRTWSDEEQIVIDAVTRVADEVIAPNAARYDQSAEFPWDNVHALNDLGLNGLFVPVVYGGAEMSFKVYVECVKLISAACASTGITYATTFHGMKPLIDYGSDAQKKRLLPIITNGGLGSLVITEPNAGSDATGMRTTFSPVHDDVVVNGQKTFITQGDVADLLLVFGKWSEIEDSKQSISVLLLEKGTPGFSVERLEDKMGIRASSTATLRFEDCRVSRANLLGEPGEGLRILLGSLNKSRPSIAAHALGIARAAFGEMVSYINNRQQSGQAIIDFQGNQFLVADLASELALCESWLDYVVGLIDGEAKDFGLEASIAKMRASDLAMRMTVDAVQMHGGYGFIKGYRVERLMRDAKITQIWEGTNQLHRQLIGRSFRSR